MDYYSMLKVVKAQNPDMPYNEQQKKASQMLADFKAAQAAHASNDVDFTNKPAEKKTEEGTSPLNQPAGQQELQKNVLKIGGAPMPEVAYTPTRSVSKRVSISELAAAEKLIRDQGVDRGRILTVGRGVIREGELVIHGKDGVNSLVTFEDKFGNRIPIYGYFKIWL